MTIKESGKAAYMYNKLLWRNWENIVHMTFEEMINTRRHALAQGLEVIRQETWKNLRSVFPISFNKSRNTGNKKTNPPWNDTMAEAVRINTQKVAYGRDGLGDAYVHILGDAYFGYGGQFRLRFFEGGTVERFAGVSHHTFKRKTNRRNKKDGTRKYENERKRSYGKLGAMWFFKKAYTAKYGDAVKRAEEILQQKWDETSYNLISGGTEIKFHG